MNNNQQNKIVADLTNLSSTTNTTEFSKRFIQVIKSYDIDLSNQQSYEQLIHSINPKLVPIFNELYLLWQQIQEESLPFSYVKSSLTQSELTQKLAQIKKSLEKI